MNNTTKEKSTRSSLACLPCRSRHIKCDGNKPSCSRCIEAAKQCDYTRSRRGGLDRQALAERRKRLAAAKRISDQTSASIQENDNSINEGAPIDYNHFLLNVADETFIAPPLTHIINIDEDGLVDSYYDNFHHFHPYLLPRRHMLRLYRDASRQPSLVPLVAAMRFVGHIYSFHKWDLELKSHLEDHLNEASPTDPTVVQSRLLYSIALFWYDYKTEAALQVEAATGLAINLGMFRREFAIEHGAGDPVLEECWRRTWWMLYIVEAFYAGTLGTKAFKAVSIEASVDLPCEESEYEAGQIPIPPKTLQQFDCREFATEEATSFSSFAYLIGAVRCAVLAMSTRPKAPVKEDSLRIMQTADSALDGWLLLLPKDRKQIMNKTGEIDELMFQAHLLIHVATVSLHRPLSDLKFNSVESVSSCARDPPANTPTPELVNIHTMRVLRSVEAQIRLLTLPVRKFAHTPFTTCMVSEGTLALLSACNFIFGSKELATAREQIRMIIGCLKVLGEVWPRIARNVREIQTIAQHVLGLYSKAAVSTGTASASDISEGPLLSSSEGYDTAGSDVIPSLESIDDLCGFYNIPNLDFDV